MVHSIGMDNHDRLEVVPQSSSALTLPSASAQSTPIIPPPTSTQEIIYDDDDRPLGPNGRPLSASARRRIVQRQTYLKYGELVVLGHNGFMYPLDRGRRRSKFEVFQRPKANGIKRFNHFACVGRCETPAIEDSQKHAICYGLSSNRSLTVEYVTDPDKDMFQIGRSAEKSIDFVVCDALEGIKTASRTSRKLIRRSTVSKFACRLLADRANPKIVRVYAGAFNDAGNLLIGARNNKWQTAGQIDGLTTSGVLIRHPKQPYTYEQVPVALPRGAVDHTGLWREVSICGDVLTLRGYRRAQEKGLLVADETNVLQDGTLIDLCGVTLLWRSAEGLARSPTQDCMALMVDLLNAGRPRCPFDTNTLTVPRSVTYHGYTEQSHVYLGCGHVQGHRWGNTVSGVHKCPVCSSVGPVALLCMGVEPSLYVDTGKPTHAFVPCGHMTTFKTVKFWTKVSTPRGSVTFHAVCPFCYTRIQGYPGYVKLIFENKVNYMV